MPAVWGSVGTTDGEVRFDGDEIRINRSPTATVRGWRAHWRYGDDGDRASVLFKLIAIAVLLGALILLLPGAYDPSDPLWAQFLQYGTTVVLGVVQCYRTYGRDTVIALDAVEDFSLDEDERELAVTYEPRWRFRPD